MDKQTFKTNYFVLLALFSGINMILFLRHGVKMVDDTGRYLEYAENLKHGFYFDRHNFWYFGYVLFILLVKIFSGNIIYIIIGQYVLSFLAVLALYNTSFNLYRDHLSALVTSSCFICFFEIQLWNSYVLAESIYISFICFSLLLLSRIITGKEKSAIYYIITVVAIVFTSLIKPTGIALSGAIGICLLITLLASKDRKATLIIACVLFIAAFSVLINKMLSTFSIMENYQRGEVIYYIRALPNHEAYDFLWITPPQGVITPDADVPPIISIAVFALDYPVYWSRLFLTKFFFLIAHIRPYWSIQHNIFVVLFLIPNYVMFFRAFKIKVFDKRVVTFSLSFLAIQVMSVCLTSEDWDGRFLLPMLPVIFLFSGRTFALTMTNLKKKYGQ